MKFVERPLPGAERPDLAHTEVIAVGFGTPEANPVGEAAGNSAGEGSLGSAVWSRKLAPRHRRAVESFFGPTLAGAPAPPPAGAPAPAGSTGGDPK